MKTAFTSIFSRRAGLFALCAAVLCLPAAAQGNAPAPVAHWLFDGEGVDIPDHSGNGNGAGILAPEHAERVRDAQSGVPALWFGGGAEGRLAGHGHVESEALAGKLPGPFSVSAWVRPGSFPPYAPVVTKVTDMDLWDDGFGIYAGPGGALGAFAGGYGAAAMPGAHPARAGGWSHVCLAFDGGAAVFYVNGLPRSSAVLTGDGTANNAPVRVGTLEGLSGTRAWHGAVADVRVYGAALSAGDVLSLFAGSPLAEAADSLGQGIPDLWALFYGLDPLNPALAGQALSEDGLTNLQKYRMGMNPLGAAAPPVRPMLRIHTPLEK